MKIRRVASILLVLLAVVVIIIRINVFVYRKVLHRYNEFRGCILQGRFEDACGMMDKQYRDKVKIADFEQAFSKLQSSDYQSGIFPMLRPVGQSIELVPRSPTLLHGYLGRSFFFTQEDGELKISGDFVVYQR